MTGRHRICRGLCVVCGNKTVGRLRAPMYCGNACKFTAMRRKHPERYSGYWSKQAERQRKKNADLAVEYWRAVRCGWCEGFLQPQAKRPRAGRRPIYCCDQCRRLGRNRWSRRYAKKHAETRRRKAWDYVRNNRARRREYQRKWRSCWSPEQRAEYRTKAREFHRKHYEAHAPRIAERTVLLRWRKYGLDEKMLYALMLSYRYRSRVRRDRARGLMTGIDRKGSGWRATVAACGSRPRLYKQFPLVTPLEAMQAWRSGVTAQRAREANARRR